MFYVVWLKTHSINKTCFARHFFVIQRLFSTTTKNVNEFIEVFWVLEFMLFIDLIQIWGRQFFGMLINRFGNKI